MTATIEPMAAAIDQQRLAKELVEQARTEGVQLLGEGGLLTGLTKSVLETALDAEMSEHVAMTSTTRRAAIAATPAMGIAPRCCSPRFEPVE